MNFDRLAADASYAADQAAAHFTAGRLLMVALFLAVAAWLLFGNRVKSAFVRVKDSPIGDVLGLSDFGHSRKPAEGTAYTVVGPLRDRIAKLQALESAMLALGDSPDKVHAAIGAHVDAAIGASDPGVKK